MDDVRLRQWRIFLVQSHARAHTHTSIEREAHRQGKILKTLSSNSSTHTHSYYLVSCQMSKQTDYNYNGNYTEATAMGSGIRCRPREIQTNEMNKAKECLHSAGMNTFKRSDLSLLKSFVCTVVLKY